MHPCYPRLVLIQTSAAKSDKTDMIWFGSKNNLIKLQKEDIAIKIGSVVIKPSNMCMTWVSCLIIKYLRRVFIIYGSCSNYVVSLIEL